MANDDLSRIPPRPALSVPFPLQLGHDFHPASGAGDKPLPNQNPISTTDPAQNAPKSIPPGK